MLIILYALSISATWFWSVCNLYVVIPMFGLNANFTIARTLVLNYFSLRIDMSTYYTALIFMEVICLVNAHRETNQLSANYHIPSRFIGVRGSEIERDIYI